MPSFKNNQTFCNVLYWAIFNIKVANESYDKYIFFVERNSENYFPHQKYCIFSTPDQKRKSRTWLIWFFAILTLDNFSIFQVGSQRHHGFRPFWPLTRALLTCMSCLEGSSLTDLNLSWFNLATFSFSSLKRIKQQLLILNSTWKIISWKLKFVKMAISHISQERIFSFSVILTNWS